MLLCGYDFQISHIKSEENVVADALSRLPVFQSYSEKPKKCEYTYLNHIEDCTPLSPLTIKNMTRRDETLSKVFEYVQTGWLQAIDSE